MTFSRRTRALLAATAVSAALLAVLTVVAVVVAACTRTESGTTDTPTPAVADHDIRLWPDRPRVELSFDVAPDLATVTGREAVAFTPDTSTCELIFRTWSNAPTIHAAGNRLTVTSARVDGTSMSPQVSGAGTLDTAPGTLVTVPLAECLAAGRTVHAELAFELTLGADADERMGRSPDTQIAWFGSGFPLLSWIRGSGWARDPAVSMNGETAVSEDFLLSELSVTAPTDFTVLGVGTFAGEVAGPTLGTTTHRFTAPAIRDVTVEVGRYDVLHRDIGDIHLHLGTPTSGTKVAATRWADQIEHAVSGLTQLLGPFPYPDLTVAITPGQSDGTEFPTALQMSDSTGADLPALLAHELAHQWFYSLVGNNQAQDPWLDEALATFCEALVSGNAHEYAYDRTPQRLVGLMGRPMSYWVSNGGFDSYTEAVYNQGAAVLLEARRRVGAHTFDEHLRTYISVQAHRVATPASFAEAFADQPPVLDLLRTAGAIPAGQ